MGVDNGLQFDAAVLDGLLEDRNNPGACQHRLLHEFGWETHSEGWAGSIMTASLDLSSTTR